MSSLSPWPHLEELITQGGQITLGRMEPVDCAAIAGHGRKMLAALMRRDDESMERLLQRLEQAVKEAQTNARITNEIKGLR